MHHLASGGYQGCVSKKAQASKNEVCAESGETDPKESAKSVDRETWVVW